MSRVRTTRYARWLAVAVAGVVVTGACTSAPPSPYGEGASPPVLAPDVADQRGRFREIFCAILEQRGAMIPDNRPCEEALTRMGSEPRASGRAIELGRSDRGLIAVVVPGVGWGCFSNWLELQGTAAEHVRQFGYESLAIDVDALSSSANNARQIRDAVMALEDHDAQPRLVLIGYSKGTPDILEAIVSYPEIRGKIAAVVSIAGAVGGSPVAEEVTQKKLEMLKHWPGAECSEGDGGALESIRPAARRSWLAENTLPEELPYYSLATCPEPENVSKVLKSFYNKLRRIDPRNDGMMLFDDQIVPDSTFMGCVNADHWAVAVPIARTHPKIAALFVDEDDYPREALLEAILRFVDEDLGRRSH